LLFFALLQSGVHPAQHNRRDTFNSILHSTCSIVSFPHLVLYHHWSPQAVMKKLKHQLPSVSLTPPPLSLKGWVKGGGVHLHPGLRNHL